MKNNSKIIRKIYGLILIILLLSSIIFSATQGSANLSFLESMKIIGGKMPIFGQFVDLTSIKEVYVDIVWNIRMPRILMAGLVGAALSVVGATFQSTFKNPLADPHILGISSGAAVGATIAMFTGISLNIFGFGIIGIFAFVGALITAVVVYQLACIGNKVSSINVILTGTAISTLLSSVISLMMVFHHEKIEKVYMWTLGSFSSATWVKTGFAAVFIFVFVIGVFIYAKELDMMITGNETAQSLGVDTGKIRKILIVFSTVLIATCVAVSGIIGFVGLIIPHCVRILSGPKHKNLLPFSCFGGAIFMIISDTLGRTLAAPSEIPVGVITAFLGTPYFIFLLQKSKKKLEGK